MGMTLYGLILWVLLGILWWFFFDVYYKYRLDVFRQELFEIRDNLFDEAARLGIFNEKAYTMTRITINGMIRFAHEVSLLRFAVAYFSQKWFVKRDIATLYLTTFAKALNKLPEDQQKVILRARVHAHMVLASHIVHSSVVLLPLVFVTYTVLKAIRMARGVISIIFDGKQLNKQWAFIDAEAYSVGQSVNGSSNRVSA